VASRVEYSCKSFRVVGAGELSERDLRLLRRRTAAAIVVHVHSLTFRITSRQLRNLLIGALFLTATAVGSGIAAADRAGPAGSTMASAVGLGIAALLYFYVVAAYAAARTECKPTGIRTRGLGGPRSCLWADVRDISVRRGRSRIVVVTTAASRRFWLGAPVDGGIMPDPDLAAKLAQIRGYWQSAVIGTPGDAIAPVWWL
jgi:hypothetical protein